MSDLRKHKFVIRWINKDTHEVLMTGTFSTKKISRTKAIQLAKKELEKVREKGALACWEMLP